MNGKKHSLVLSEIRGDLMPEEMTAQSRLRAAVFGGVAEADVIEIVKKITADAKQGDAAAQDRFFKYVLGGMQSPKSVEVHNHFADVEQGARVAQARLA